MNLTSKYETWKQQRIAGAPPVYLIVTDVILKEGEVHLYRIMDLRDFMNVKEISPAEFSALVEKKILVQWKVGEG